MNRIARAFALSFCLTASVCVQARIVYVVEGGTGAKGGTAWTNASSSVAEAYTKAQTDATADRPNEVWIRYGQYTCKDVSLKPYVTVRGGFTGVEELAEQADPVANPTILHDGNFKVSETWNDSAKSVMWSVSNGRYVFHEPPVASDAEYKGNGTVSDTTGFTYGGGGIGQVAFHGLIFTKYGRSAIRITDVSTSTLVLRQCRFLNVGWTDNDYHVIHNTSMPLDAFECDFIGVRSAVFLTSSDTSPICSSVLRHCRFFSTSGRSSRSGGMQATKNVAITLVDCSFDRNRASSSAGTIYANIAGDLTIEDCVFSRGRCNNSAHGGAICYDPTGHANLTIRRSRFEDCEHSVAALSGKSAASALAVWGSSGVSITGVVENVAFIGNTCEVSTSYPVSSCMAFCAGSSVNYAFNFVNCLFERNRAVNKSSSACCTTVGSSTSVTPCAAFVNCVFKDDVCGYTSGSTQVRSAEIGANLSTCNPRFAFVNTVFDNEEPKQSSWLLNVGATYKPFSFANCATCAASDYGTTVEDHWSANASCFRLGTLANNATIVLEDASLTNGTVVARRLGPNSIYRHKGRPVWRGTDGVLYLCDATSCASAAARPWVACWTEAGTAVKRLTPSEAEELELSTDNAPIPDAFDAARGEHSGLGNLNAHVIRGLRVGIRRGSRE